MGCIEINSQPLNPTRRLRLIETWDVLKCVMQNIAKNVSSFNRNMGCIEILVNEIMASAGGV